jgi:uroporphyrin-III C-methyltransferase
MTGTVYLVGAGPGAADLLTLRAARLLAQADVVLHDALVNADVLAIAAKAKKYNVGKRANKASVDQRFTCRLLTRLAMRHAIVVRLKGGDPNLFGRATEEMEACRAAGISVVSVPGVSAGFAAAASLGASLTQRTVSRSVAFVTPTTAHGACASAHWADAAATAETAVIYMGAQQAERVAQMLIARGVPASRPVALVENASSDQERIIRGVLNDLATLATALGDGPATILVGEVVAAAGAVANTVAAA